MFIVILTFIAIFLLFSFTIRPYLYDFLHPEKNKLILFYPLQFYIGLQREAVKLFGDPNGLLRKYIQQNPKLERMISSIGPKKIVAFVSPQLIKLCLNDYQELFEKHVFLLFNDRLFKQGLVFSHGKQWKKQRKFTSEFFKYDSLKQRVPLIVNIVKENLEILKANPKFMSDKGIYAFTESITGEVVVATFFGESFKEVTIDDIKITSVLTKLIVDISVQTQKKSTLLRLMIFGKYFYRLLTGYEKEICSRIDVIKDCVRKTLDERHKLIQENKTHFYNFVDLYIQQYEKELNDPTIAIEDKVTIEEIIQQFLTFFVAGTDTTGVFLGTVLAMLGQHPQYQERILDEVRTLLKDKPLEDINLDEIKQLKLLDAFASECLRYSPFLTDLFIRKVKQDFQMGHTQISPNNYYTCAISAQLFNPEVFPEPDRFHPERWLTPNEKLIEDSYRFCPFSAGPRNCIGQHLALLESKLTVLLTLQAFEIKLKVQKLRYTRKFLHRFINDKDIIELTPRETR